MDDKNDNPLVIKSHFFKHTQKKDMKTLREAVREREKWVKFTEIPPQFSRLGTTRTSFVER